MRAHIIGFMPFHRKMPLIRLHSARLQNASRRTRLPAVKRILDFSRKVSGGSSNLALWLLFSIGLPAHLMPVSAQDVACVFLSPARAPVAGAPCSLWLYCMNSSSETVKQTFAPQLKGELMAGSQRLETVLRLNTNNGGTEAMMIPPGAFARREYVMDVPSTVSKQVVLTISNYNQLTLYVESFLPRADCGPTLPGTAGRLDGDESAAFLCGGD